MPIPIPDLGYDSENDLDEEWISQRESMVTQGSRSLISSLANTPIPEH